MHLVNRKILKGRGDLFSIRHDIEKRSMMGIIQRTPIDVSNCTFTMYVHRHVEYECKDLLFSVEGIVANGEAGLVYFHVPAEETDIQPATYWYTVEMTKPNGKVVRTEAAKYIIANSMNPYYNIYNK